MSYLKIHRRVRDAYMGFDREIDNLWEELDTTGKMHLMEIWEEHIRMAQTEAEAARERLRELAKG